MCWWFRKRDLLTRRPGRAGAQKRRPAPPRREMRAALRTDYPESGNSLPRSSSFGHRITGAFTV